MSKTILSHGVHQTHPGASGTEAMSQEMERKLIVKYGMVQAHGTHHPISTNSSSKLHKLVILAFREKLLGMAICPCTNKVDLPMVRGLRINLPTRRLGL